MKKILVVLLSVAQVWIVEAQSGSGRTPPYLQKSFSSDDIQTVESETSGGNISVYGVPASEARVEVFIYSNHGNGDDLSRDEIRKRLEEQYDLILTASNHKLTATARRKHNGNDSWRKGLSISFKIYVPSTSSSVLRTSGGNISLRKLSGSQDFKTSGGNLDIDQITGRLTGRTSGGNIDITDSKNDIDLVTSGGNIAASNCEGSIRLSTSGGNLTLRILKGTIKANTSGGNVTGEVIDGELSTRTSGGSIRLRDMSCSLTAGTSSGNVDVTFKELGKFLTLSTSGGNISAHLPGDKGMDLKIYAENVRVSSMQNFKGETDEHHVDGSLNGGGIPVKMSNSGGRISLDLK